jgi:hypothetical protein
MRASPTYKQLEASLRIGSFTIKQWAEILSSGTIALLFAVYVSPLSLAQTMFVSTLVAGAPIAISYGAMAHEWSVVDAVRSQWRWFTRPRHLLPGPGLATEGYRVVTPPPKVVPAFIAGQDNRDGANKEAEGSELWDF